MPIKHLLDMTEEMLGNFSARDYTLDSRSIALHIRNLHYHILRVYYICYV